MLLRAIDYFNYFPWITVLSISLQNIGTPEGTRGLILLATWLDVSIWKAQDNPYNGSENQSINI